MKQGTVTPSWWGLWILIKVSTPYSHCSGLPHQNIEIIQQTLHRSPVPQGALALHVVLSGNAGLTL